jgi:hypothetical protein
MPLKVKLLSAGLTLGAALLWLPLPRVNSASAPQPGPTKKALVRGFITVVAGGPSELGQKLSSPREVIYLPNIKVTVHDLLNNTQSDPVTTDLSGRFTAFTVPGRVRICWEGRGFPPGCSDGSFSVSGPFTNIGAVQIPIPRLQDAVAVYGHVTLADGTSPRTLEPTANINAFATISLLAPGGKALYEVPVNNDDQYLFPVVPLKKLFDVRINEEKYDRKQGLELDNASVPVQRIDFAMVNHRPVIEPLVALDNNKVRVANASPGVKVVLASRASDPDNDKLGYFWEVSGGTLSSATDPEPTWMLPTAGGNHAATLIVYDHKGGYAKSNVNIPMNPAGLVFSGTVAGTDTLAIKGAEVDVNGVTASTDSRGYFLLHVPDKQRFVMTIRKPGYGFSSNVYYSSVPGGHWVLTKASLFTKDPKQVIDVQNERTPRECMGSPTARLDWKSHPRLAIPEFQDGRGNAVSPTKDVRRLPGLPPQPTLTNGKLVLAANHQSDATDPGKGCGPGVRVTIPANSLVDGKGKAPAGNVTVQISTVDLQTPGQMPGNYTVFTGGNQARQMQSYGAGIIEISSGSTRYNLRAGAKAQVIIPVDRGQLLAGGPLPPTIPLLAYDEKNGGWIQSGTATLQPGGKAYTATVSHFTAYNTDLIKTDQSCVSLQNQSMPPTYDLEVTIPQLGGAAPVKRLFPGVTGGNTETVLINLPKLTNITLVPIRTTDPDPNKNNLPIGVFVVNTGQPQNPAWPIVPGGRINEPVGPPYYHQTGGTPDGACSTQVSLHDAGLSFYPGTPPHGAFLHGLGSFAAVNLTDTDPAFPGDATATLRDAVAQASVDYRHTIDPRGFRSTLSCFKAANRMPLKPGDPPCTPADPAFVPQAPLTDTATVYANTADLGFGREMHCVQDGANVGCFVSNYDAAVYTGPGDGPDITKAQDAVLGLAGTLAPTATVAMEFSQIEDAGASGSAISFSDPDRVVKFYVFNAAGDPVDAANLDGLGARPIPQLCMVCHGGYIPNPSGATTTTGTPPVHTPVFCGPGHPNDVKLKAKFLPFDLRNFTFAAPDSDAANPNNKLNQQSKFQTLNQMVKVAPPPDVADPSSNVISDLYDAWYPANALPQLESAVVSQWNTDALHSNFYVQVEGRSCRTCHVTNASPNLRFEKPGNAGVGFEGNLGLVQQRVCKDHVMPHARRTHDLFWTSTNPSQPAQLQAFGDSLNNNGWQNVNAPGVDPTLACGEEFTPGGGSPVSPGNFTPVQTVFSGSCVGCHNTANAASGFGHLDLSTNAYSNIVNHASFELPSMNRITSSDTAHSYLLHKINGTHTGLAGCPVITPCFGGTAVACGGRMPCGGTLGAPDVTTITNWITGGALP